MNRSEILDAAKQAVTVDRAATHGSAENTFALIAGVWSALLRTDVSPPQVALMLAGLKMCRAWGNPGHDDNWVDLAGYAACGGELADEGDAGVGAGFKALSEALNKLPAKTVADLMAQVERGLWDGGGYGKGPL